MHQPQPEQHFLGRVAVSRVGWGDHDEQRQALRVHDQVPLASIDFLACVVAAGVLADGLGGALSRWLTDGMIFWLIKRRGVVGGERVAVVQGSPVPGRGDLPLCVAVLPLPAVVPRGRGAHAPGTNKAVSAALHRYNTRRRHSSLGQRSPIAYETALETTSTTLAPAA